MWRRLAKPTYKEEKARAVSPMFKGKKFKLHEFDE
jgi:hypothetical protein